MMDFNRKFKQSLILSAIYVLVINVFFGTYFDTYESWINSVIMHESAAQINYDFFVPLWFLITPIFSFLNSLIPGFSLYALVYTIINIIVLGVFIFGFLIIQSRKKSDFKTTSLYILLGILLYTSCIVYVNNQRAAFLLVSVAFFLLFLVHEYSLEKRYKTFAFVLMLTGVLARLEIAIIAVAISFLFVLLFYRKLLYTAAITFLFVIGIYTVYNVLQGEYYSDVKCILKAEHELYDRNGLYQFKDDEDFIKYKAMGWFIRDDNVYDINDYYELIENNSVIQFLTADNFWFVYWDKLVDLYLDLASHFFLVLLLVYGMVYLAFRLRKFQYMRSYPVLRLFILSSIVISLPFLFSIYILFPYGVVVSICTALCMLFVMFLYANYEGKKWQRINFWFLLLFLTLANITYFDEINEYQNEMKENALSIRKIKEFYNTPGFEKTIVFAQLSNFSSFPSRLFSTMQLPIIKHYNLDYYLSHTFSFYKKHNEEVFGDALPYLDKRIEVCANQNIVLISNDFYNDFLKKYLKKYHQIDVQFKKQDTGVRYFELRPYLVVVDRCL